jgi:LCP family protein required for cell wall assembly
VSRRGGHSRGPTVTRHGPRSLGSALLATLASAVVPGTGLFMIRRKRAGTLVLGVFLLIVIALLIIGFTVRRAALVQNLLSSRVLLVVIIGLVVAGLAWVTQIVRTYALASPRGLTTGSRVVGVLVVAVLSLAAAAPFGYAANLVNSQRALLNNLFAGGGGTAVADAINKPRLNVLLVGSDAGPDRTGARTDTMMMASIDTTTARTTLFALPRNIGFAQFPPGTPMAEQFPKGFHDAADPLSGNYLLNAVYAWGLDHPQTAPTTPTDNPGLNLLHQSIAYMMGIDIDYYVEVNMAGFASIIDALGGVTVDVGPVPLPIGGVLPDGRHVKPSGYVPAGVQHLNGNDALWFARSRRDSDDYNRMGRQRCLLQSVLQQKSPTDVITHFNDIAAATKNSVTTNIPQEVLGQLVSLASEKPPSLQSISFDPNLPDPNETDGHFNTSHVDVSYMREVVQNAFAAPAPAPAPTTTAAAPTTSSRAAATTPTAAPSATPAALACG